MTRTPARPFRSREWFAAPKRVDMAALYLERYSANGLTRQELRSGKPIIGISQSGSDLVHSKVVTFCQVEDHEFAIELSNMNVRPDTYTACFSDAQASPP